MRSHLPAILILACWTWGCPASTPLDLDGGSDEDAWTPPEPSWDACVIIGYDDLDDSDYVLQIRNPDCSSGVCLHHGGESFCTHQCGLDRECRDVGGGTCGLQITVGNPEMIGSYCVLPPG